MFHSQARSTAIIVALSLAIAACGPVDPPSEGPSSAALGLSPQLDPIPDVLAPSAVAATAGPVTALHKAITPAICVDVAGGGTAPGAQLQIFDCNGTTAQAFRFYSDGTIHREGGANLCWEVPGGAGWNGQRLVQATCNGGAAQRFSLADAPGGVQVKFTSSGHCVDITGNSSQLGTKLQLYGCNLGEAQVFALDHEVRPPITQLHRRSSPGMCIDVPGGVLTSGTALQTFDCNHTDAQLWQVLARDDVQHEIRRAGSNLCFEIPNGQAFPGQRITQSTCSGGAAQRFLVEPIGRGLHLRPVESDQCVQVRGNAGGARTPLELQPCDAAGGDAQAFTLDAPRRSDGLYQLTKKRAPNMCVDVPWGTTAQGTQLQIWACNRTGAQLWQLGDKGDGQTEVRRAGTDLCLDIPHGDAVQGQPVNQYRCNNSGAQRFRIEALPGGAQLRFGNSNLCVDVMGNDNALGTKLQLYACNGTPAQIFSVDQTATQVKSWSFNTCVTDLADSPPDFRLLSTGACNRTDAQRWELLPLGDDVEVRRAGTPDCWSFPAPPANGNAALLQTCGATSRLRTKSFQGLAFWLHYAGFCIGEDTGLIGLRMCYPWTIDRPVEPVIHQLRRAGDGPDLCIDGGSGNADHTSLQVLRCARTAGQRWEQHPAANGWRQLRRSASDLCMTAVPASGDTPGRVELSSCDGRPAQSFLVGPIAGGVALASGDACVTRNPADDRLLLQRCTGGPDQTFKME